MTKLNAKNALIFRITHVHNVPWILEHGLHCKNSPKQDPHFVSIGNPDLILKRTSSDVPIAPYGTLADYVPFYFTPWSGMMYNIYTGYQGITKRDNREIAILVSSLHKLGECDVDFVFTNGHAYMKESDYFDDLNGLETIDWGILQSKDFQKDPEDPGKLGRYHAEALIHRRMPVRALLGIACYDEREVTIIQKEVDRLGLSIPLEASKKLYF